MQTTTETTSRNSSDNFPLAAAGLTSYRCRNPFGWTMIGARDNADAMREARRSYPSSASAQLEIWNGVKYVPATPDASSE
jgi:hypothetical protein